MSYQSCTEIASRKTGQLHRLTAGSWLVVGVAGLLLLVVTPVLIQGGLLADDYIILPAPSPRRRLRTIPPGDLARHRSRASRPIH